MRQRSNTMLLLHVFISLWATSCYGANDDEFFDIMNDGTKAWRLAFRGTAFIGKSVFEAYKNGTGISATIEPACKQLDASQPCQNHYRNNDALDKWANVDEVAFVVYLGNMLDKYVIFDGTGTNYMNWFKRSGIKQSSWPDIATAGGNYFSIPGHPQLHRRFFAEHNYGGCPNDAGWFVAIDALHGACTWEQDEGFPVFKYATGDKFTNWTKGNYGTASMLAVFVKYSTGGVIG